MNVNKGMMFGVPLVLMFGPDTGPLLLLFPHVTHRISCFEHLVLGMMHTDAMPLCKWRQLIN